MASAAPSPAPGTYTNEEEVYFDREAKRTPAPWIGILVDAGGKVAFLDAYGKPAKPVTFKTLFPAEIEGRVRMTLADGRATELRLARSATCWGAVRKGAKKPDGSDDYDGKFGLKLHDQGGRVAFGGPGAGSPPVILRMRNVIWPSGPNRPSLVLYVHTPDQPDHAVSYSWADSEAKTVGINLRWMQGSCTIDNPNGGK